MRTELQRMLGTECVEASGQTLLHNGRRIGARAVFICANGPLSEKLAQLSAGREQALALLQAAATRVPSALVGLSSAFPSATSAADEGGKKEEKESAAASALLPGRLLLCQSAVVREGMVALQQMWDVLGCWNVLGNSFSTELGAIVDVCFPQNQSPLDPAAAALQQRMDGEQLASEVARIANWSWNELAGSGDANTVSFGRFSEAVALTATLPMPGIAPHNRQNAVLNCAGALCGEDDVRSVAKTSWLRFVACFLEEIPSGRRQQWPRLDWVGAQRLCREPWFFPRSQGGDVGAENLLSYSTSSEPRFLVRFSPDPSLWMHGCFVYSRFSVKEGCILHTRLARHVPGVTSLLRLDANETPIQVPLERLGMAGGEQLRFLYVVSSEGDAFRTAESLLCWKSLDDFVRAVVEKSTPRLVPFSVSSGQSSPMWVGAQISPRAQPPISVSLQQRPLSLSEAPSAVATPPARQKRSLDQGICEDASMETIPTSPIDAVLAAADSHWREVFGASASTRISWDAFSRGISNFYANAPENDGAAVFALSDLLSVKSMVDKAEWRRFFFHFRSGPADNTSRHKVDFVQAVHTFLEQPWFSGSLCPSNPDRGFATVRYSSHTEALVLAAHAESIHNYRIGNHRPGDRFVLQYKADSFEMTTIEFAGDSSKSFFYAIPKADTPIDMLSENLGALVLQLLCSAGLQCSPWTRPCYVSSSAEGAHAKPPPPAASEMKARITLQPFLGASVLGSVKEQASAWWSGFFGDRTEVSWTEFASKVRRADKLGSARLLLETAGIVDGHQSMLQPAVCLERWKVFVLNFRNGTSSIVPGQDPSDALDFELAESLFQDQRFHGFIGGTEAIAKLSGSTPGRCLLRFTTSPSATSKGRLTLSFVDAKKEVVHLVIGRHVAGEQTVSFCNLYDLALPAEDVQHSFFYDANAPGRAPPFDIPIYSTLSDLLHAVEKKCGFFLEFFNAGQYVSQVIH